VNGISLFSLRFKTIDQYISQQVLHIVAEYFVRSIVRVEKDDRLHQKSSIAENQKDDIVPYLSCEADYDKSLH
jgi:hypothetical protein